MIAIIAVALIIKVIAPALAANAVGGAVLNFTSLEITNPGTSSFSAHAVGVISNAGPFSGTLLPATFTISYNSKTLGTMNMPQLTVIGSQDSPFDVNTNFTITDLDAFNAMTKDLINKPSVVWGISASVSLNALGLSFKDIEFSKSVVITAAGGLQDVNLLVFDLTQSTPDTIHVILEVSIQNPSIVSIVPLGDLTFNLFYLGSGIGMMICDNATLVVGSNILHMSGNLVPENLTITSELFNRFLTGQSTVVSATAASNASTLPLFNTALQGLTISPTLQGLTKAVIAALDFTSLSMNPIDNTQVGLGGNALISIYNPLGSNSPIGIQTAAMNVQLISNNLVLGTLSTPPLAVVNGSHPVISLALAANLVFYEDGSNFISFVEAFLQNPSVELSLVGTSNVVANTAIGQFSLTNIPVNQVVTLTGINNFPSISILSFNLPSNSPAGGITLSLQTSLGNPSIASVAIGTMVLDLYYGTALLGSVTGTGVTLVPGNNSIPLVGNINPSAANLPAASTFFSNYVNGINSVISVRGASAGSSNVTWVQQAVKILQISAPFAGATSSLINSVSLSQHGIFFPGGTGSSTSSSVAVASFSLPFNFPLSIWTISTNLTIFYNSVPTLLIPVPFVPSTSNEAAGTLAFSFSNALVDILSPQQLENFGQDLLLNPSISVQLQGVATTVVSTAAGNLTLSGISFTDTISVAGYNKFSNPPLQILAIDAIGGTAEYLTLSINISIPNPSIVFGQLGGLTLNLFYNNELVGYCDFELGHAPRHRLPLQLPRLP